MKKLFCLLICFSLIPKFILAGDEPVEVITHKIEKNIVELPSCKDKDFLKKTEEFINTFARNNNEGTVRFNRRYALILRNLDKFEEVSISNYKTEQESPISDYIIDLKLNHGVIEENMRLCQNQSLNKDVAKVYLLVYAEGEKINGIVLNLKANETVPYSTLFQYK